MTEAEQLIKAQAFIGRQVELPRHVSHFFTCPNANKHRKAR